MEKKDKRQYIRLKAYHLVKYKRVDGQGQKIPLLATVRDIGAGGVCLRTQQNLPVSSILELRIQFPSLNVPIFTLAKVVWVKSRNKGAFYELGLQFTEIQESMRKIIEEQVKLVNDEIERQESRKKGLFRRLLKKKGGVLK